MRDPKRLMVLAHYYAEARARCAQARNPKELALMRAEVIAALDAFQEALYGRSEDSIITRPGFRRRRCF
jgi:hypothetical protein